MRKLCDCTEHCRFPEMLAQGVQCVRNRLIAKRQLLLYKSTTMQSKLVTMTKEAEILRDQIKKLEQGPPTY